MWNSPGVHHTARRRCVAGRSKAEQGADACGAQAESGGGGASRKKASSERRGKRAGGTCHAVVIDREAQGVEQRGHESPSWCDRVVWRDRSRWAELPLNLCVARSMSKWDECTLSSGAASIANKITATGPE